MLTAVKVVLYLHKKWVILRIIFTFLNILEHYEVLTHSMHRIIPGICKTFLKLNLAPMVTTLLVEGVLATGYMLKIAK